MEGEIGEMTSRIQLRALRRCPAMDDLRGLSQVLTEEQFELLKEAFPQTEWSQLPRSKHGRQQGVKERSFPHGELI